jgi:DNA-binding MarR family transcriptional regulator
MPSRKASQSSRRRSPASKKDTANAEILGFMRLMWAVDHGLQRTSKHMNRTLGLTGPQRLVIRLLGQNPGMSAGDLAAELHLDPSTLTGILQRLESRKLVARAKDPGDARRLRLTLTDRGHGLDAPAPGTIEAAVSRGLTGRPPREVKAARGVLTAIAEALAAAPEQLKVKKARRAR